MKMAILALFYPVLMRWVRRSVAQDAAIDALDPSIVANARPKYRYHRFCQPVLNARPRAVWC